MLSNPFASELAEDSEIPSPILLRKWPYDASSEIFRRKCGVALGFQAGTCCEKASASPLARVFSTTNPAFAQRINPCFLSLFDSFAPTHLALRANLLLLYRAPAPGAWLWLKNDFAVHDFAKWSVERRESSVECHFSVSAFFSAAAHYFFPML